MKYATTSISCKDSLLGPNGRSLYGDDARKLPERTNEVTGTYAKQCIELAKEMNLRSIDLWSKMQETEGWQKKFLRFCCSF